MKVDLSKADPMTMRVELIGKKKYWIKLKITMCLFWVIGKIGLVKIIYSK